jgi:putative ABC transport system ATP-binding protein
MPAILSAYNVHKQYYKGNVPLEILRGINLEVPEGESVAVLGVSGSGKTTLLNVIAGLDRPDDGTVYLAGANLYKISEVQRANLRAKYVGFVFQSYNLLPDMTVLQNVCLPAMARSSIFRNRKQILSRALELLQYVGLGDRTTHVPLELSGGEQQRVALARALINNPKLILADEPTGNLDTETEELVLELLFRLVNEQKTSLVIVTHNKNVARRCNRVFILENGLLHPLD